MLAVHMISEDMSLVDIWRLLHPREREYTFFSRCHRSLSRINMFSISNNTIKQVIHCKINAMSLSDCAAIELDINMRERGRWRMNVSLLQDNTFNSLLKEDLKFF